MKAIIAYIEGLIRYLETRQTVATITADLHRTVEALEVHAADQIATMKAKTEAASKLLKERAEHEEEHILASKTAQNIKALLSV